MEPGDVFRSLVAAGRTLLLAILINVVAILLIPVPAILLILAATLISCAVPTASDDEMISLLTERRPAFEALVAKLLEGHTTGTISRNSVTGGMRKAGAWIEEVRPLMRMAGVGSISFMGPTRPIHISYSESGVVGGMRYKSFIYRPSPITPPPPVMDLRGEDGPDIARALLCSRDRRSDLNHLCNALPWVNDLDILIRYDDGGDWDAERPIDEHWSLELQLMRQ